MKDESAGRRAAAYWFADGLPDIVFGLTLLLFASAGILWRIYAPHPWVYDFWLVSGGTMLFMWQERAILDILKSHVTYPRTGYVQPPEEDERAVIPPPALIILSLSPGPPEENVTNFNRRTVMVILFILFPLFGPGLPARWITPLTMLVLAAALYVLNRRLERPFRWWWALILALTGLVFLFVDVPPLLQPLLSYLLAGGWLAAQGGWALFHYLRANRHPTAAEAVRA
jgi:hypothetical protein